jgi:hypothetical protein
MLFLIVVEVKYEHRRTDMLTGWESKSAAPRDLPCDLELRSPRLNH